MPPQPPQPTRTPIAVSGRRVLGSTKALSPAVKARTVDTTISPSASTTSLNSQFSSAEGGGAGVHNGGNSFICPICSEEMVTLLQLNRHLDDAHGEVEEEEINDVKSWFKKRVLKAKQFQPVAVINQKLKGLDIFESNHVLAASPPANGTNSGGATPAPKPPEKDPDELVTRAHWQKSSGNDFCLDPMCQKPLGVVNGNVNCRKCGKLFCEEHTMYQMKLSRAAQHEPVRGFWCRVCETCFKSREGYNDHNGLIRDHTSEFNSLRTKTIDRTYLEATRLEKRLTKLTQLLTQPSDQSPTTSVNGFLPFTSQRSQRRQLEQKVVVWEEDDKVSSCPICNQTFSKLGIRKHHCRLCGRVVCGDLRTGCSIEVGLNVTPSILNRNNSSSTLLSPTTLSEKPLNDINDGNQISLDIRICRECRSTIWSKRDFYLDLISQPPLVRAYSTHVQFQDGITSLLPRFQKLLFQLQDHRKTAINNSNSKNLLMELLSEATSTRKKLENAFTQYESSGERISKLPTDSPNQLKLQKSIHEAATQFLEHKKILLNKMLPVKDIPGHLVSSHTKRHKPAETNIKTTISNGTHAQSLSLSSLTSPTLEEGLIDREKEKEEKYQQYQQQLIVLEEQKFMLNGMLSDAKKGRRWDEMGTLRESMVELEGEIGRVKGEIEALMGTGGG